MSELKLLRRIGSWVAWPWKKVGAGLGWAARTIEGWSVAMFIRAIEPAAILIAIIAFGIELGDRQEERTARAWQLVTTQAPGNSGKIQALEYLNEEGHRFLRGWLPLYKRRTPLIGINLAPPALVELQIDRNSRLGRVLNCPATTYLVGVQLEDADLQSAQLPCGLLMDANLQGASLDKANLWLADLRGADLERADFSRADLLGADLSGAELARANLSDAVLWKADLNGAVIRSAELNRADLTFANLSGADLREADLSDAVLWKADLNGAVIRSVDLYRADLTFANLSGADLREADLTEALLQQVDFGEANLAGANLSGVELIDVENLTQEQLDTACADPGNPPNRLPNGHQWRSVSCQE